MIGSRGLLALAWVSGGSSSCRTLSYVVVNVVSLSPAYAMLVDLTEYIIQTRT